MHHNRRPLNTQIYNDMFLFEYFYKDLEKVIRSMETFVLHRVEGGCSNQAATGQIRGVSTFFPFISDIRYIKCMLWPKYDFDYHIIGENTCCFTATVGKHSIISIKDFKL